ncbi:hypothetical protein ACP0HM_17900 [Escherichia coli]
MVVTPIEKEKQITTYLDKGKMQLSISAPQAWLKIQRCKLDASLNFGIMVLLGHFLTTIYMPLIMHHIRAIIRKNISSYGQAGVNLGARALRTDYQYDQSFNNGKSRDQLDFSAYLFVSPNPSNECKTNYRSIRY